MRRRNTGGGRSQSCGARGVQPDALFIIQPSHDARRLRGKRARSDTGSRRSVGRRWGAPERRGLWISHRPEITSEPARSIDAQRSGRERR
jgi:hypothetical protein